MKNNYKIESGASAIKKAKTNGVHLEKNTSVVVLSYKAVPKEGFFKISGELSCHNCSTTFPFKLDAFLHGSVGGNDFSCPSCDNKISLYYTTKEMNNENDLFILASPLTYTDGKKLKEIKITFHLLSSNKMDFVFQLLKPLITFPFVFFIYYYFAFGYAFGFIKNKNTYISKYYNNSFIIMGILIYIIFFFVFLLDTSDGIGFFGSLFMSLFAVVMFNILLLIIIGTPWGVTRFFSKGSEEKCEICKKWKADVEMGTFYYGTKTDENSGSGNKIKFAGKHNINFCKSCAFSDFDKFLLISHFLSLAGVSLIFIGLNDPSFFNPDDMPILINLILLSFFILGLIISPFRMLFLNIHKKAIDLFKNEFEGQYNYLATPSEYEEIKKTYN